MENTSRSQLKRLWDYVREKASYPGVRRHSKNMGWMFFGRIGGMIITFVATAYMARNLGPVNFGQLSYAVSYVGLFSFFASLGIDQILYRDLIRFPEKRNVYMGSAMTIRLVASVIAIIVCITSALIWSSEDVSLLLIFIVSLTFVFGSFQLLSHEFQAEAKAKYPSFVSLIVVFILNILKIAVIVRGEGVIYLALVILAEPILYGAGLLYFRIREYGSIRQWKFDRTVAVSILRDSYPLIFASAFFAVYARIDQVMIKHMLSTESVGLYDSAVRISELCYFLPNIIVGALFPAIINSRKSSEALYARRTKKLFLTLVILSILTSLFIALFSKYLILIIFGGSFLGALAVLNIYVWSNVGAAINLLTQQLLIAENLTKTVSASIFLGMICNVGLNIVLIPKLGMSGAAYATLISYVVPFLSLLLFKRSRDMLFIIFKKHNAPSA
jgi:O-antigen/teichoic acid export membrane protein